MKRPWMPLLCLILAGCGHEDTIDPGTWNSYRNPVWQADIQNPSVFAEDGHFYLFSSETSDVMLPMAASDDLTGWDATGSAIDDAGRPDFIAGGTLEAPEIASVGGKYLLYYSLYKSDTSCGIGVAVADVPTGPFQDQGALLTSTGTGLQGVHSPSFLADGDANYLVFGRYHGIYIVKLSGDGLSVAQGSAPVRIAADHLEAPCIFKRDGKYCLFASSGTVSGASSTCKIIAGRADRPEGPYFSREGSDMLAGGGDTVIGTGVKFAGPGHGCIVSLPDGSDWMVYNAYDLSDVAKGRTLMLDRILWTDGWPSVRGAISSFCTDAPVVQP